MKQFKKSLFHLFCINTLVLALVFAVGCGKGEKTKESDKKVLGFSIFDMQYNFFQEMEKGTRDAAEELGYKYILHDQKSDPAQMVAGCENLITRGIDVLIISPFEPSALTPVVKKAKKHNIPVIINDIGGGNSQYDVIVISDCFGGGVMAAEYMDKMLKKRKNILKKVGIIKVDPGHIYAARRGAGFKKRIIELGYTVVSELCANDVRDQGYRVTQDMMTANPDIEGIFCENDPMALGAVYAIRDKKKSAIDDILVVGFNADPEAIEAIKANHMAATIQQIPYEMGKKCVELATKILNKEKLKYTNDKLREITIPVKLITKEDIK